MPLGILRLSEIQIDNLLADLKFAEEHKSYIELYIDTVSHNLLWLNSFKKEKKFTASFNEKTIQPVACLDKSIPKEQIFSILENFMYAYKNKNKFFNSKINKYLEGKENGYKRF